MFTLFNNFSRKSPKAPVHGFSPVLSVRSGPWKKEILRSS